MRIFFCLPLFLVVQLWVCIFASGAACFAASAYSSRHSGLEPPGGPRQMDSVPQGRALSRTAEGGMGYTDAYGNTVGDIPPREKATRNRPRAGAYGTYGRDTKEDARPLPDPVAQDGKPAWSFK